MPDTPTPEQQFAASLDIRDPGQPAPPPSPAPSGAAPGIASLPGASAPDPMREFRDGLAAVQAQLAQLTQQPEPEPPAYNFDPYTGQPLQPQYQQPAAVEIPDLDPNEVAEPIVRTFNGLKQLTLQQQQMLQEQREQMEQMRQEQQQREQARAQQVDQRRFAEFEKLIAADQGMKDVLGEGDWQRHVGTPKLAERARLALAVDALQKSGAATSLPEAYEMAKAALYRDRVAQQAQQQVTERLRDQTSGRFISKPTATTRSDGWEAQPFGTERAIGAVAEALRNRGGRG